MILSGTGIFPSTIGNRLLEITTLPSCQFAHFLLLVQQLKMSWHVLRKSTTYGDHLCRDSRTGAHVERPGNCGRRTLFTFVSQSQLTIWLNNFFPRGVIRIFLKHSPFHFNIHIQVQTVVVPITALTPQQRGTRNL